MILILKEFHCWLRSKQIDLLTLFSITLFSIWFYFIEVQRSEWRTEASSKNSCRVLCFSLSAMKIPSRRWAPRPKWWRRSSSSSAVWWKGQSSSSCPHRPPCASALLLLTFRSFILAKKDAEGRQAASNLPAHHPQIHANQQVVQPGEPAVPHPESPGAEDPLWWAGSSERFCDKCCAFILKPFEGETSIFTRKLEVWFEKVFGISLKDTKQRDPWIAQIYKWVLRMSIFKIKAVTRTTVTHTNTDMWMWPETLGCFPSWTFQSGLISEQR